ncbi:MAG: class I SAM-dependent methyltransferase [Ruminococcus sp.]|nr:class I SAM-dependent methyltransferase [Ruminococcus sp.]
MGLFKRLLSKKSDDKNSREMSGAVNTGNAKLANWGIRHLGNLYPSEIIELGCGAGRNVPELLKTYPSSRVTAVDQSKASLEKAKEYNKRAIESGRYTARWGDVSKLDEGSEQYDLATAFETISLWPTLKSYFAEVARVLKKGGTFMIVNESDGTEPSGSKLEKIIDGVKQHTAEEIEAALVSVGFSSVRTAHHDSKPWITVIAKK